MLLLIYGYTKPDNLRRISIRKIIRIIIIFQSYIVSILVDICLLISKYHFLNKLQLHFVLLWNRTFADYKRKTGIRPYRQTMTEGLRSERLLWIIDRRNNVEYCQEIHELTLNEQNLLALRAHVSINNSFRSMLRFNNLLTVYILKLFEVYFFL